MFELFGALSIWSLVRIGVNPGKCSRNMVTLRLGVMGEKFQLMSDKNFQSSQNGCHTGGKWFRYMLTWQRMFELFRAMSVCSAVRIGVTLGKWSCHMVTWRLVRSLNSSQNGCHGGKGSSYCLIRYFQSCQNGCQASNMFEIYGALSENVRGILCLVGMECGQNRCQPGKMFEEYGYMVVGSRFEQWSNRVSMWKGSSYCLISYSETGQMGDNRGTCTRYMVNRQRMFEVLCTLSVWSVGKIGFTYEN